MKIDEGNRAKCIRHKDGDQVRRVSGPEADAAVASGEWHYCPKSVWKAAGRP